MKKRPAAAVVGSFNSLAEAVEAFKAYVKEHKLEKKPDLGIVKRFFTKGNISQLWVELKRSRDKANMSVGEAWTPISKM